MLFRSTVSRIDPQATFTPENTYFREDRVKQVVGVKLQLKGAFGFAKPGMPAEGEILVSGACRRRVRVLHVAVRRHVIGLFHW